MEKKLTFKEKLLKLTKINKKKANKQSLIALIFVIVLMAVLMVTLRPPIPQVTKEKNVVFTATFVGDMMFGRNVEEVTKRKGVDYIFEYVKPYFKISDYITGNFENPVVTKEYQKFEGNNIHLSTTPNVVEGLKRANFSVLNIANNHMLDYGIGGLNDTFATFEKYGVNLVGAVKNNLMVAENNQVTRFPYNGQYLAEDVTKSAISYIDKNGLKIATLGFTDVYVKGFTATTGRSGVLPMNPELVLPLVKEASLNADLVFVHIHWGQEYDNKPSPRQKEMAKAVVDAGADVIIGHHPHVLSSVEVYKDAVIFYSLGNFIFDQGWSRTRETTLVQYNVLNDGKVKVELIPMRIKEGRPQPIGKLGWYYKQKIYRQLTKDTSNKKDWNIVNDKLTYTFTKSLKKSGLTKNETNETNETVENGQ